MELKEMGSGLRIRIKVLCLVFVIVSSRSMMAQDIPLFTQKLTNSFLYNPALAGDAFGSFTYSYRKSYSEVKGAPQSNFLSLHAPFSNYRFGAGINFFQEEINFLKNTYASAAFAYHLYLDKYTSLSMGVSGEYNSAAVNGNLNFISGTQDPTIYALQNGKQNHYDFAAGLNYQARFFKIGMSANRLSSWLQHDEQQIFNQFF